MSCATLLFPRIDLYEDDYFGDHSTMSFESAVDAAWTLFKQWKQRKKISCSQPKFSASSAPGITLECVRKPHVHTLRTFFNCKVFSGREADWSLKAYNGRVVNAFLADLCLEHARRRGTEHSWLVAECMSSSQSVTISFHCLARFHSNKHALGFGALAITASRTSANVMQTKLEKAGRYLQLGSN